MNVYSSRIIGNSCNGIYLKTFTCSNLNVRVAISPSPLILNISLVIKITINSLAQNVQLIVLTQWLNGSALGGILKNSVNFSTIN